MRNGNNCGLPAPTAPSKPGCEGPGGNNYCHGEIGASVRLGPGATGAITIVPTNAQRVAGRWLHMTATTTAGSPVGFSQAFTVQAISIMGDNQMGNAGPVIGSTWAAEQTNLNEYWNKLFTANNPLTITVTNLDPVLTVDVYAAAKGDFDKG